MTVTDNDIARLDSFLAMVKTEAKSAKALESGQDSALASAQRDAKTAQTAVAERDRDIKGFNRPRFSTLARIGAAFAQSYSDNVGGLRMGADAAAHSAASEFAAAFTDASDKTTKGGGTVGLYKTVITTGVNAERVRKALAERVAFWEREIDSKPDGESAKDRAERLANARRFTTVASCGAKGKHKGRPSKTFTMPDGSKIVISNGEGTNRTNQLAAACVLFQAHGDNFLHPDVLDAFLDNGGLLDKAGKDSVESIAASAHASIMSLMDEHGGRISADGAMLTMALAVLRQIADTGKFTPAVGAQPIVASSSLPMVNHAPESSPAPTMTGAESTDSAESLNGADSAPGADSLAGDVADSLLGGLGDMLNKPVDSLTGIAAPPAPPAPDAVVAENKPARKPRRGGVSAA